MPQKKTSTNTNVKTITVSKEEYDRLREVASRFEMMRSFFELDFFAPPPTQGGSDVVQEFEKTGKYNKAFLKSLEQGLKAKAR